MSISPERDAVERKSHTRSIMIAGYIIIALFFGGLGVWASMAPLDKAVVASGSVEVATDRIEIQHLEGGIIQKVHVKEGDSVKAGDIVVAMNDVAAQAELQVVTVRLKIAEAVEARLKAERRMDDIIAFPEALLNDTTPLVMAAIADQKDIFEDRRSLLDSEVSILQSRVEQLQQELQGQEGQRISYEARSDILKDRLDRMRPGLETGSVSSNQFSSFEEEFVEVQSNVSRMVTEKAKTQNSIGEAKFQILQAQQRYRERASTEYSQTVAGIRELREQIIVAQDVLERTKIRSPIDGTAQNLQTNGRVIRPSQVLLEVVPDSDQMVIHAQVSPLHIDDIYSGLGAEVRFSSFPSRNTPIIIGYVKSVSRGAIVPENPQEQPYFLAVIDVERSSVPENIRSRLSPGMPVEVMITTGERTVLDYIVTPMTDAIHSSMREE